MALCATADSVSFAHAGATLSGALMIPLGLDAGLGAGLVSEAELANFVGGYVLEGGFEGKLLLLLLLYRLLGNFSA